MLLKRIIYQLGKYPLIALLTWQSLPLLRKATTIPDKKILEKPYQGQPILFIALYQVSALRPDIARLLQYAKKAGLYVIGINNATLHESVDAYFDCYIERFNAGRDFGSYKTGFEYLFSKKIDKVCPRLIMMNDSIYYDTTRLPAFIDALIQNKTEVLGATENFEITYHLGSFCIAMSNRILTHEKFHAFWKNYALSEVRLVVIDKGELGLSRCLRECVSDKSQFKALYNLESL